uniref:Uncharacterized protein n=1 Tax=Rhizophora mucronata TaxID=61149 RepID=A0A2P2MC67_RHIMU
MDVSESSASKKDTSTSTEDLDAMPDTREIHDTLSGGSLGFPALSENRDLDLEVSSVYIPPDQMRMIQNINALISELALEKEDLMQAFASESSQCSKLKVTSKSTQSLCVQQLVLTCHPI